MARVALHVHTMLMHCALSTPQIAMYNTVEKGEVSRATLMEKLLKDVGKPKMG